MDAKWMRVLVYAVVVGWTAFILIGGVVGWHSWQLGVLSTLFVCAGLVVADVRRNGSM